RQLDGGFYVDAGQHAVAADVGIDDGFAAVILEFAGQVQHIVAREFAPAVGGDLAVARVQADDDVAGKGAAGVAQETGILDRRRADDDIGYACVQIAFDGVQIAYAAAYLYRDVVGHRLDDGLDGRFVLGFAGYGAIQVDQVQAPGSLFEPLRGH